MKYLAYFSGLYRHYGEMSRLVTCYEEALAHAGVVGLIIGTRPDCMPGVARTFGDSFPPVLHDGGVWYRVRSMLRSQRKSIGGTGYACAVDAVRRTAEVGIPVGAHDIGLPRKPGVKCCLMPPVFRNCR